MTAAVEFVKVKMTGRGSPRAPLPQPISVAEPILCWPIRRFSISRAGPLRGLWPARAERPLGQASVPGERPPGKSDHQVRRCRQRLFVGSTHPVTDGSKTSIGPAILFRRPVCHPFALPRTEFAPGDQNFNNWAVC